MGGPDRRSAYGSTGPEADAFLTTETYNRVLDYRGKL